MREIEFVPKSQEAEALVPRPRAARSYTPEWFKKTPAFENNEMVIDEYGKANSTEKLCMPFSDTFSFGYIQETWCDIHIKLEGGRLSYSSSSSILPILQARGGEEAHYSGNGFYGVEFAWYTQWAPKVPKGYSVLYTHPLNRFDLPFYSFSGVVESDKYFHEAAGNHPFLIKENFSGIIPAGTPMFQMIPFKREDWNSKASAFDKLSPIKAMYVNKNFYGTYRKEFWKKKTYK